MTVYVYRPKHPNADEQGFVDKSLVGHEGTDPHFYVISDTMPETRHMATGKFHTSKHTFRQDTKASGCIEYGTDSSLYRPRKPITLSRDQRSRDIKQAIEQLRSSR